MPDKELITLAELGLELGLPKSSLAYWKKKELIKPIQTIAKTDLYKYPEVVEVVKKIIALQQKGLSLVAIKNKLEQ